MPRYAYEICKGVVRVEDEMKRSVFVGRYTVRSLGGAACLGLWLLAETLHCQDSELPQTKSH